MKEGRCISSQSSNKNQCNVRQPQMCTHLFSTAIWQVLNSDAYPRYLILTDVRCFLPLTTWMQTSECFVCGLWLDLHFSFDTVLERKRKTARALLPNEAALTIRMMVEMLAVILTKHETLLTVSDASKVTYFCQCHWNNASIINISLCCNTVHW